MLLRSSLGASVYFLQLSEEDSFFIFIQLASFKQNQKAHHITVLSSKKNARGVFIIMEAETKAKKT